MQNIINFIIKNILYFKTLRFSSGKERLRLHGGMVRKGTGFGQTWRALDFNLQKPSWAAHSSQTFILKIASVNQIDFNFPS